MNPILLSALIWFGMTLLFSAIMDKSKEAVAFRFGFMLVIWTLYVNFVLID